MKLIGLDEKNIRAKLVLISLHNIYGKGFFTNDY